MHSLYEKSREYKLKICIQKIIQYRLLTRNVHFSPSPLTRSSREGGTEHNIWIEDKEFPQ